MRAIVSTRRTPPRRQRDSLLAFAWTLRSAGATALLETSAAVERMRFANAVTLRLANGPGTNHDRISNEARCMFARMTAAVTPMAASVEATTFSLTIRRDSLWPTADEAAPGIAMRDILCVATMGAAIASVAICRAVRASFLAERTDMAAISRE